jgi:hypothetical protein
MMIRRLGGGVIHASSLTGNHYVETDPRCVTLGNQILPHCGSGVYALTLALPSTLSDTIMAETGRLFMTVTLFC